MEKPLPPADEQDEGGTFLCSLCGLSERYDYKGCRPPFCKKIVFLEDSYVMRDPFSSADKQQFLLLGGECSLCRKAVCQAPDCSMFYAKRFCLACARNSIEEFPDPVQAKL